ncbi:NAD(P)/FAD-dependent oxidoreductase [Jannaschia marina]|uniref:NAD(P)/FAD-dependent oxidoreductase n=1 Tax=Jannaschia marina TaxID=2741674 RepID=UPI0015CCD548|nr:FAD-dependent oxidoreductase [Jannaschia marina]
MRPVTILGAGIVGVCCALTLRERGHPVEVIDRADPGEGASHGNAGVISPWSVVPQPMPGAWRGVPGWLLDRDGPLRIRAGALPRMVPWGLRFLRNCTEARARAISRTMARLATDNVHAYRRYLDGTAEQSLVANAMYVNVFRPPDRADLTDLAWRLREEIGAPLEVIDAAALRALEPALADRYHAAILIKDQARARHPGRLTKVLAAKARALGVRFRRAEVTALARAGASTRLVTRDGPIDAELLVLAAGYHAARLAQGLGLGTPLIAERGYHVAFPNAGVTLDNSIMEMRAKVVASSMEGALRVAGTAEFAPPDAPPAMARVEALTRIARAMMPGLDVSGRDWWMGIRPSFPDSLPAVGPMPAHPGVIAAFGHSHYGMILAPGTARLVAEMIAGAPNDRTLAAALDPGR